MNQKNITNLSIKTKVLLTLVLAIFSLKSVEAARTYDTLKECEANARTTVSRANPFTNPCDGSYRQWGTETTVTRGCVQLAGGEYLIEETSRIISKRNVWSAAGRICNAIAYEESVKTSYASSAGGNVQSIEYNRSALPRKTTPAYEAQYGIPYIWDTSVLCLNTQYRNNTSTATCATYSHAVLQWLPGNQLYWFNIGWLN